MYYRGDRFTGNIMYCVYWVGVWVLPYTDRVIAGDRSTEVTVNRGSTVQLSRSELKKAHVAETFSKK